MIAKPHGAFFIVIPLINWRANTYKLIVGGSKVKFYNRLRTFCPKNKKFEDWGSLLQLKIRSCFQKSVRLA